MNTYNTRNTFPDIPTKKLKVLYNHNRTNRFLAGLWIFGAALMLVLPFVPLESAGPAAAGLTEMAFIYPFAALNLISGILILRGNRAGRILGIIVCALMLPLLPIGTAIGILGIISFAQSKLLFGADRLDPDELIVEFKQRKKHGAEDLPLKLSPQRTS